MKSFYRYIIFLFLLFIVQDVLGADGGDVLDRKVDLPKMKGTVYSLLSNISQQTGYLFIYDIKVYKQYLDNLFHGLNYLGIEKILKQLVEESNEKI